ncbi:hypothetical protein G8A07_17710 [Roseateles sp. DAIF2]|uniref:hypothetical protein n=1 Tax=Roseateles sp. DAIF2 TaxID=2714952 RepID=UPI0018A31500|nr:hypothetical protein [Roseateles sp. DAIF2]QPF74570.1 hypothetical protein G8A07_17710 [Roseateles sp. DAIF2]
MRKSSLTLLALVLAGLLSGCATQVPQQQEPEPSVLFHDELFRPEARPEQADAVFALTPEMQAYLEREIAQHARSKGGRQGLLDALYNKSMLQLEYDAAVTRNAAEAFGARRGNCLSLVLMTSAFAKAMNLPVRFNSVYVEDLWSRSGDLYVLSGHVNLSLGRPMMEHAAGRVFESELLTIDFLPPEQLRGQRSRVIEEHTVVAMFLNNRAAEELQLGHTDAAYWWARAAVAKDPRFMAAYNTLGVVYRRAGRAEFAEQVFRNVMAQEPGNAQTLSNLVLVLRDRGRGAEAELLAAKLRDLQPDPPFKFYDQGILAMKRGEFQEAKRLFTREIERSAYYHEFHFWLALANYGLGEMGEVRKHLALARDNSTTVKDRQRYAAKLESIRSSTVRVSDRRPG